MKKNILLKIVMLLGFYSLFNACNNELNTVEAWKDVPIVYGILSIDDTATYIRVEKAFVDQNTGAYQLAKIADSLYYKDATVTLYRTKNTLDKFTLTRVDGTTEGYPRNAGIFATTPNVLYKIKTATLNLKEGESWTIEVQRKGETKPVAKSSTTVVGNFDITFPYNETTRPLSIAYDKAFNVRIESETEKSTKIFDVNIIVNYDETIGSTTTKKSVTWAFATGTIRKGLTGGTPEPIVAFSRLGKEFYQFMQANVKVEAGAIRKFTGIDVEVLFGGQEFIDYQTIGSANIGITGSQTLPVYTNITGGLGIFTSRAKTIKKGVQLDFDALDLLKNGEYTRTLNFR